jgi:hypothetical protein
MRSTLTWLVITLTLITTARTTGAAPSPTATPAPAGAECRAQSAGDRPSLVTDDIVNCVITLTAPQRVRLTVNYTYASPLGNRGIWMGVDVLAAGNRLKWFGYRPAAITGSSGTATIEIMYGQNAPPRDPLSTDQIELFMYVGGGQIFYREIFALKHEWRL